MEFIYKEDLNNISYLDNYSILKNLSAYSKPSKLDNINLNSENYHMIYKLSYPNGKVYIGQAHDFVTILKHKYNASVNTKKRKKQFCEYAIHKYKWENIKIHILCTVSVEYINLAEQYFIALYDSANKNKGYNIQKGGKYIKKNIINKKYIYQYDFNGNLIKIWNSVYEIEKGLNINSGLIYTHMKRKGLRGCGGFIFRKYLIDINEKERIKNRDAKENTPMWNKKHTKESKLKMSNSLKGRKLLEKTKEKIKKGNTGKIRSYETKKLLSEIKKNMSEDEKRKIYKKGKDNHRYKQLPIEIENEILKLIDVETIRKISKKLKITDSKIYGFLKEKNINYSDILINRKKDFEENIINLFIVNKYSVSYINKNYNIKKSAIRRILKKYNIKTKNYINLSKNDIEKIKLLRKNKLSYTKIGKLFNIKWDSLYAYLKRHNLLKYINNKK